MTEKWPKYCRGFRFPRTGPRKFTELLYRFDRPEDPVFLPKLHIWDPVAGWQETDHAAYNSARLTAKEVVQTAMVIAKRAGVALTHRAAFQKVLGRDPQVTGFAKVEDHERRMIASKGGRAAHQKGTAHEYTHEEAREAGRKGGRVSRGGRGKLKETDQQTIGA